MHPDAKLNFDKAAEVFGLDPALRDLTWRRMTDLGVNPDDPLWVYLAVTGLLEKAARTIPEAVDAVPARVEQAARRAVGPVAQAASARVEAAHAMLAQTTGAAVAASASEHFRKMERTRAHEVGLWAAGIVLASGIVCGGVGYRIGRAETTSVTAQWSALSTRADGSEWLKLIAANADMREQMVKSCGPHQHKTDPIQKRQYCEFPLWVEGTVAPVGGFWDALSFSVRSWLLDWGAGWLVVAAGLTVLVARRVLRAVIGWQPAAWLLK
ncbi:hypothetical protein ABID82_006926 [Methylobacterium sp. PvP062]|jgi:hypothetical protein|uniref:Uncharacterized protein n=1 Tax=Methylobacterium radiotolerans TaxID=31998 RepID=A0ABV2N8A7_9HYPH|nr:MULTISPECIES: hypothetical protein [unclassified Methylobacterium]MBP2498199.1 hypothetical protein [Methylobacterium sp. PvP105]MBP2506381.1 hypothetical protein [Methylobacterium sp. PvP109]